MVIVPEQLLTICPMAILIQKNEWMMPMIEHINRDGLFTVNGASGMEGCNERGV